MKRILVPTDFSAVAKHAAEYAYQLAQQLNADMVLCNAVTIPTEIPEAGFVSWPMEETDILIGGSEQELKKLKLHIQKQDHSDRFKPAITYLEECGEVTDVVNRILSTQHIDMVVMGTHGSDSLNAFLLGNHCGRMINNFLKSLMVIPPAATFRPIKKIAFAIDLESAESDLQKLYQLIPLAKKINAEILIIHVSQEKEQSIGFDKKMKEFLTKISNNADYSNIYYRIVENGNAENGLIWLCEHGQIDVLAMVHRQHGFFDSLFNGSHTQRMVNRISIPLLVLS